MLYKPAPVFDRRHRATSRQVRPPSERAVNGVLQWIAEAQVANRAWARNALSVIACFGALLLLAIRLGVVRQ